MDLKQIKQIIDLMKRSDLTEFAVEEEGFKLKIRRGSNGQPVASFGRSENSFGSASDTSPAPTPTHFAPAPAPAPGGLAASGGEAAEEAGVTYIKSPMVGTFYRSPSPDSKPFAEVGTRVSESTPVCIIEAMKIMNEIQAETKGVVTEVLVENGQPVEYGQRLFKVKAG